MWPLTRRLQQPAPRTEEGLGRGSGGSGCSVQLAGHFKQCHLRPACLPPALVPLPRRAPCPVSAGPRSQCIIFPPDPFDGLLSPFPSISQVLFPPLPSPTEQLSSPWQYTSPAPSQPPGPLVCWPVATLLPYQLGLRVPSSQEGKEWRRHRGKD